MTSMSIEVENGTESSFPPADLLRSASAFGGSNG